MQGNLIKIEDLIFNLQHLTPQTLAARQVSADLSRRAAAAKEEPQSTNNKWTEEEIVKFLAAVNRYGLKASTMISQYIGSRSVTQVANFKQRYAEKHPLWAIKHSASQPIGTREQGTRLSPSVSPSSSPAQRRTLSKETGMMWDSLVRANQVS